MKKTGAFLLALAMCSTMGTVFASGANNYIVPEEDRYHYPDDLPTGYFKVEKTDNITVYGNDKVYINSSKTEGDINIPTEFYYYDRLGRTRQVVVKIASGDRENIKITDAMGPFDKYGASPFTCLKSMDDYFAFKMIDLGDVEALSFLIQKSVMSLDVMKLTGERTDDYPLAVFNTRIKADIPAGNYSVFVYDHPTMRENGLSTNESSARIAYDDKNTDDRLYYHFSDNPAPVEIHVSDEDIGDISGNNTVDDKDASLALFDMAAVNNEDIGLTPAEEVCADVNFDGVVDDIDAEIIMDYTISGTDMEFEQYLQENVFIG